MPDFDLDYPDDQAREMIRYAVGKMANPRSPDRDLQPHESQGGCAGCWPHPGLDMAKVDYLAKLIPGIPGQAGNESRTA
jgi:hypothetical protein